MALYGFDIKPISRIQGDSVAKTASYILRENVHDLYWDKTYYYSYVDDLLYSGILIPDEAPDRYRELSTLLREIEQAEKRYDARLGKVIRLTLPNERIFLTNDLIGLVHDFVGKTFLTRGMCAVIAIHEGKNKNPLKNNPHAHIMLTDRPVDANGFCARKNREWNKREILREWRKLWAEAQNKFFKDKGLELRVSHESLEVQGIDREPTVPLGRAAMALERKGVQTEYGNRNREIELWQKEQLEKEYLHNLERKCKKERER